MHWPPTINIWSSYIHEWAIRKGWWPEDKARDLDELTFLVKTELAEAFEEFRRDRMGYWQNENGKPEGFSIECADAIIRILDFSYELEIPMPNLTLEKIADIKGSVDPVEFTPGVLAGHLNDICAILNELVSVGNTANREKEAKMMPHVMSCLRKLSWLIHMNGDIPTMAVLNKVAYNEGRPTRHGGLKA